MNHQIESLQQKNEELIKANSELKAWVLEYNSHKQSLVRMSARLKKLCKRLDPSNETIEHMQKLANELKELAIQVTSKA